jgi:Holliday junction resolvase RusA-like endonuclease
VNGDVAHEVRFVVFGHPQGKGSKRVLPIRTVGAREAGFMNYAIVDANRAARPWAARVASAAHDAHDGPLIRGGVQVGLAFYFARPKTHWGTGRNARALRRSAPAHMITMPDVDKLARCALDALVGIVIADDAQVASLTASKHFGEPERLEVRIARLG